jgi:hypothetical protein
MPELSEKKDEIPLGKNCEDTFHWKTYLSLGRVGFELTPPVEMFIAFRPVTGLPAALAFFSCVKKVGCSLSDRQIPSLIGELLCIVSLAT